MSFKNRTAITHYLIQR